MGRFGLAQESDIGRKQGMAAVGRMIATFHSDFAQFLCLNKAQNVVCNKHSKPPMCITRGWHLEQFSFNEFIMIYIVGLMGKVPDIVHGVQPLFNDHVRL